MGAVMNFELNKSNKGNYGWLDLQRMNLPFTTMNRTYSTNRTNETYKTYMTDSANAAKQDYPSSLPAHLHPNVGDDKRTRIS